MWGWRRGRDWQPHQPLSPMLGDRAWLRGDVEARHSHTHLPLGPGEVLLDLGTDAILDVLVRGRIPRDPGEAVRGEQPLSAPLAPHLTLPLLTTHGRWPPLL